MKEGVRESLIEFAYLVRDFEEGVLKTSDLKREYGIEVRGDELLEELVDKYIERKYEKV